MSEVVYYYVFSFDELFSKQRAVRIHTNWDTFPRSVYVTLTQQTDSPGGLA